MRKISTITINEIEYLLAINGKAVLATSAKDIFDTTYYEPVDLTAIVGVDFSQALLDVLAAYIDKADRDMDELREQLEKAHRGLQREAEPGAKP